MVIMWVNVMHHQVQHVSMLSMFILSKLFRTWLTQRHDYCPFASLCFSLSCFTFGAHVGWVGLFLIEVPPIPSWIQDVGCPAEKAGPTKRGFWKSWIWNDDAWSRVCGQSVWAASLDRGPRGWGFPPLPPPPPHPPPSQSFSSHSENLEQACVNVYVVHGAGATCKKAALAQRYYATLIFSCTRSANHN